MKFAFEFDTDVDPKLVRAMLTRGYEAHKEALDAENLRHTREGSKVSHMLDEDRAAEEEDRHNKAIEKLRHEGDLWKEIMLSLKEIP